MKSAAVLPYQLVACDLDGTLLPRDGSFMAGDLLALRQLESLGVKRVIATGRSLYSAQRVLEADFPIDFLVFSSGAGILEWKSGALLSRAGLEERFLTRVVDFLDHREVNYMVHDPVPENHYFSYRRHRREDTDFERRLDLYRPFARPAGRAHGADGREAAQVLAIIPPDPELLESITVAVKEYCHVIRTTSPLDGRSIWLEIFPRGVSKGSGIRFLCDRFLIEPDKTIAVGNDYNDEDMLEMAGSAWVVADAPEVMKRKYGSFMRKDSCVLRPLLTEVGLLEG